MMRNRFWVIVVLAAGLTGQSGVTRALETGYCFEPNTAYAPLSPDWTSTRDNGLSTGLVTITSAAVATSGNNILASALPATNCAGIFIGNDQPAGITGHHGDGLLNGESQQGNNDDPLLDPNVIFNPGAFVTAGDLQDLDQDGQTDDAGWINLFKTQAEGGNEYLSPAGLDLTQYLTIGATCNGGAFNGCSAGEWFITYQNPLGLLEALALTELGDSFFDHLAIIFKQASKFIVLDFDFNLINDFLGDVIDLGVPYDLRGTFDVAPIGWNGLSHISFAARDPIDSREVPTPAPLGLVLLGLVVGACSRRPRRITQVNAPPVAAA